MTRANTQYQVPRSERDDQPSLFPEPSPVAARETPQPGGADMPGSDDLVERNRHRLLPGLALVIQQCGPALEEARMKLDDLKLAHEQDDVALFKSAAYRLASLANHVARMSKTLPGR